MKLSAEQRKALGAKGVTLDAQDATVEDGLKALLSVEAPKPVEVTEKDIPKLLSVDPEASRYFSAWRKSEDEKVAGEVKTACASGRMTAEMAEAATKLLSITKGYSLSAKGEAEAVDVPELVRVILSGIPANGVVPVKESDEDLKASAGKAPDVDTKKFSTSDAVKLAKQMLERVG